MNIGVLRNHPWPYDDPYSQKDEKRRPANKAKVYVEQCADQSQKTNGHQQRSNQNFTPQFHIGLHSFSAINLMSKLKNFVKELNASILGEGSRPLLCGPHNSPDDEIPHPTIKVDRYPQISFLITGCLPDTALTENVVF